MKFKSKTGSEIEFPIKYQMLICRHLYVYWLKLPNYY